MMFCKQCGSEMDENDVCPKCGYKESETSEQPQVAQNVASANKTEESSEKKNEWYWKAGIVASIIGFAMLFFSWFDVTILWKGASYTAWDMAFSSVFQEGGLFENFNQVGKFFPLICGIISGIMACLFFKGKDKNPSAWILVIAITMIILPLLFIGYLSPATGDGWERKVGNANYITIVVAILAASFWMIGHKGGQGKDWRVKKDYRIGKHKDVVQTKPTDEETEKTD